VLQEEVVTAQVPAPAESVVLGQHGPRADREAVHLGSRSEILVSPAIDSPTGLDSGWIVAADILGVQARATTR
jgi:hypothetical protein